MSKIYKSWIRDWECTGDHSHFRFDYDINAQVPHNSSPVPLRKHEYLSIKFLISMPESEIYSFLEVFLTDQKYKSLLNKELSIHNPVYCSGFFDTNTLKEKGVRVYSSAYNVYYDMKIDRLDINVISDDCYHVFFSTSCNSCIGSMDIQSRILFESIELRD